MVQFPEFLTTPGAQAYPDLTPYPMTYSVRLRDGVNDFSAGTSQAIVRGSVTTDPTNPTFLAAVSFGLYRTENADGATLPTNVWLPTSISDNDGVHSTSAVFYGRSFEWRFKYAGTSRVAQDGTGWRASSQCPVSSPYGYCLPVQYELKLNDSVVVEARPLGEGTVGENFVLIAYLHYYKMILEAGRRR